MANKYVGAGKTFNAYIDLVKNELRNARIQNLSSAPSSPVEGLCYFDTTLHEFGVYSNGTWVYLAASAAVDETSSDYTNSAVGDTRSSGSSGLVADAKHTHGREAFAAPTAETTFGTSSATGSATTIPHSDHTHGNPTHVGTDHSAIKLSDLGGANAGDISLNTHKLTNVTDPASAQDAATKNYVDNVAQGLSPKGAVQAATTAALPTVNASGTGVGKTLTATSFGALVIDGYTVLLNDRILVKNQATTHDNGIYVQTALGDGSHDFVLTRATDFDDATEIAGGFTFVLNGTVNANQGFIVDSAGPYTMETTAITFTQFTGVSDITAGTGLTKSGNTLSVSPVPTYKYATTIGDGSTLDYTITHNLGTTDVLVQIFDITGTQTLEDADITVTSTNVVHVVFGTGNAPATNTVRVVVIG